MTRIVERFAGRSLLLAVCVALCGAVMLVPQFAWADEPSEKAPATIELSEDATFVNAVELTKWERLWGWNAYGTMEKIVQAGWKTSKYAVVATSYDYYDALSASSLAGRYDCPVLITKGDVLSQKTADELERLKVEKVFIVGGTAAVSSHTENQIKLYGIATERVAGINAQRTALEVAKQVASMGSEVAIVATAKSYHDALAAGPYAYASHSPIYLTNGAGTDLLDDAISQMKTAGAKQVLIAGGEEAVAPAVEKKLKDAGLAVERIGGYNAYGTARLFAEYGMSHDMRPDKLAVATGADFPDALCGAALCGMNESVLLLADTDKTYHACEFLTKHRQMAHNAYILGGTAAVSQKAEDELKKATRIEDTKSTSDKLAA